MTRRLRGYDLTNVSFEKSRRRCLSVTATHKTMRCQETPDQD